MIPNTNKVTLPPFYTANPLRLPPLILTPSEISALTALVYELRDQDTTLSVKFDDIQQCIRIATVDWPPPKETLAEPRAGNLGIHVTASSSSGQSEQPALGSSAAEKAGPNWSTKVASPQGAQEPYKAPTRAPSKIGTRSSGAGTLVKAIKRPLTCFVGRLDHSTSADDLKEYLAEVGIHDADCWRLVAKDGRTFKTAAIHVSCHEKYRELFYDESNWPEGAELRDWVFCHHGCTHHIQPLDRTFFKSLKMNYNG